MITAALNSDWLLMVYQRPTTRLILTCVMDTYKGYYDLWQFVDYSDVIMSAMASQITSVSIVYSTVCSGLDQRKCQSSASLAIVGRNHRWPVNSPHKGPVTRKMFPFVDVIKYSKFDFRRNMHQTWFWVYLKHNNNLLTILITISFSTKHSHSYFSSKYSLSSHVIWFATMI